MFRKIFRQSLTAFLTVIFALNASIVGAKIQIYTATGEDYPGEFESQDISKQRALDKAIKKAAAQAGVYLKTYSRSVNSELTDEEITAITSNSWQTVSEPKYTREIINHSDDTQIIVWKVTVEVNVDDSEIQSWLKRDYKDRSAIISQTRKSQKIAEENARQIEDLREKYKRATSQAEKDSIRKQMNDVDRDFLANQKLDEGAKLYYAKNYNGTITLCNEALKLKPNFYGAYAYRGLSYFNLNQYEQAIENYNKAIQLDPSFPYTYVGLGTAYGTLQQHEQAIINFSKAIQLNPSVNVSEIYTARGLSYLMLNQCLPAMKDFNKAIQLNPNLSEAYICRGMAYLNPLKQYDSAIQDFNRVILLNPNCVEAYIARGCAYAFKGDLNTAIEDETKAIQLNPNEAKAYNFRGLFYKLLGDETKSQSDLAKAKALGLKY